MGGLQPQLWRGRRDKETRVVLPQINDYPMGRWQRSRRGGHWLLTCAWREPDAALWLDRAVFVRPNAPRGRWAAHAPALLVSMWRRGNPLAWQRVSARPEHNPSMYVCMCWAAWRAETCSIASAWLHMGWQWLACNSIVRVRRSEMLAV